MKRVLIIAVATALALTASFAFGALGDVYASWPAPGLQPIAVARANSRMYVYCSSRPYLIYTLTTTGSIVGSYPSVAGSQTRGLAYSWGGYLWQGKISDPYRVYYTYSSNGSTLLSWALNNEFQRGIAPLCTGDGGSGTTRIFTCDYMERRIYERNMATGSVYRSFLFSSPIQMYDIAWDWRNQLVWGGMNTPYIYGINRHGSPIASFAAPAGLPWGIAYHGNMLYIATVSDNRIWKVHCPDNIAVEPASLGRVKALFK